MSGPSARRDTLNIRIRAQDRGLIEQAAESLGKTKTDFILDAARRAAEEALLDRHVLVVGRASYDDFLARLDAAPAANPRLARALATPAPWDRNGGTDATP